MVLLLLGVVLVVIEVVASHDCYKNLKKTPPGAQKTTTRTNPLLLLDPPTISKGLRVRKLFTVEFVVYGMF